MKLLGFLYYRKYVHLSIANVDLAGANLQHAGVSGIFRELTLPFDDFQAAPVLYGVAILVRHAAGLGFTITVPCIGGWKTQW